jgi:hypothetical protein
MSDTIHLELSRTSAAELHRLLGQALQLGDQQGNAGDRRGLFLPDDHPLWARHSGLIGHSGDPEWNSESDLQRAQTFYRPIAGKAKVLLDLLIDNGGYQLDVEQIIELTGSTFTNSRSIAGSINGMRKAQEVSGRRYPFYWWEGEPALYAMKYSVAELFQRARANLG